MTTTQTTRTKRIPNRNGSISCYRFYVGIASWATIEGRPSGSSRSSLGSSSVTWWVVKDRSGNPVAPAFDTKREAVAFCTARWAS